MAFIKLVCLTILLSCLAVYSDAEEINVPGDKWLLTEEQFEYYVSNKTHQALYCFGHGFDFDGPAGPFRPTGQRYSLKCDGKFSMTVHQMVPFGGYRISWVNRVDGQCDTFTNKDFTLGGTSRNPFEKKKAKLFLNTLPGSTTTFVARFVSSAPGSHVFMVVTLTPKNGGSTKVVAFLLLPGMTEIDLTKTEWQAVVLDKGRLGTRFGARIGDKYPIKYSWRGEDCGLPTLDSSIPYQANFPDFPAGFPSVGFPNLPTNQNSPGNPPSGVPPVTGFTNPPPNPNPQGGNPFLQGGFFDGLINGKRK